MSRDFQELLRARWRAGKFACVGLDTRVERIPACIRSSNKSPADQMLAFNMAIAEATAEFVCAFKPNIAFYEAYGVEGVRVLTETCLQLHYRYQDVPVILDAKRADIGSTNEGYVQAAFDHCGADAITVNPYFGQEALQPFLEQKEKGIIVLCRTSNPGASEFQNLLLKDGRPLYLHVAEQVATKWNTRGNCALVVGATAPEELHQVRSVVEDMPILIPGIGKQGGDLRSSVVAGVNSQGQGMIINSSRGIIFASNDEDFAEVAGQKAKELNDEILSVLAELS